MIGELATDIDRALHAEAWTAALAAALALPDICAALASDDGETSGARYRAWWTDVLGTTYPRLQAEDAYSLRCGVLHQGRDRGRTGLANYHRIIFTVPGPARITLHNNVLNGALNLDLPTFCRDVGASARRWYVEHFNDPNVQHNRESLIQWREQGLAPYIVGFPVLT